MCRRSAVSNGCGAAIFCADTSFVSADPHIPQNLEPAGLRLPQSPQRLTNAARQLVQKKLLSGMSAVQLGHRIASPSSGAPVALYERAERSTLGSLTGPLVSFSFARSRHTNPSRTPVGHATADSTQPLTQRRQKANSTADRSVRQDVPGCHGAGLNVVCPSVHASREHRNARLISKSAEAMKCVTPG